MPTRKITPMYGPGYEDPTPEALAPGGPSAWQKFKEMALADPLGVLGGSTKPDRWRPGQVPPRRAVRNVANSLLVSHGTPKERENAAHELHAGEVARTHAAGETTAVQGANTPPRGSGGEPTDAPPPPLQSGVRRGVPLQELATQDPYRSRMRAVRRPDGTVVFTNDLTPYGGEEAEVVPYEEAISGMGGRFMGRETTPGVSTPITADGTAYVHDRPDSGAVAPVALEARPPMTGVEAEERAAATTGSMDQRSIMERRAWTERRLAEERAKAMEEAALAEAEQKAAIDPYEMAEIEASGRWAPEQLEQVAEAERSARLAEIVKHLSDLKAQAMEAGDDEAVRFYDAQIRDYQRAYGRSVPEPRAPGFSLPSLVGDEVDEKLEEKKAQKK